MLAFGESIMQKAIEDEDFRLGLQAIDRARMSLEQLLKVHGLLPPENAGSTVIDQRKQQIAIIASVPEQRLRDFIDAVATGREPPALEAGYVTDNRALSAAQD